MLQEVGISWKGRGTLSLMFMKVYECSTLIFQHKSRGKRIHMLVFMQWTFSS